MQAAAIPHAENSLHFGNGIITPDNVNFAQDNGLNAPADESPDDAIANLVEMARTAAVRHMISRDPHRALIDNADLNATAMRLCILASIRASCAIGVEIVNRDTDRMLADLMGHLMRMERAVSSENDDGIYEHGQNAAHAAEALCESLQTAADDAFDRAYP